MLSHLFVNLVSTLDNSNLNDFSRLASTKKHWPSKYANTTVTGPPVTGSKQILTKVSSIDWVAWYQTTAYIGHRASMPPKGGLFDFQDYQHFKFAPPLEDSKMAQPTQFFAASLGCIPLPQRKSQCSRKKSVIWQEHACPDTSGPFLNWPNGFCGWAVAEQVALSLTAVAFLDSGFCRTVFFRPQEVISESDSAFDTKEYCGFDWGLRIRFL